MNSKKQTLKAVIKTEAVNIAFNKKKIIHDLTIEIPAGQITAIIGPNGCGKSTILKAIGRLIPVLGSIKFKERNIKSFSRREFARLIALLPQAPQAPPDLTVEDLVEMGRFPHRTFLSQGNEEDKEQIEWALAQTQLSSLRQRLLSTLSGGEKQRAWIAMALAQCPEVLFLDEPTTYLDISHQLEVMQLCVELNRNLGLTVVMVLHDLNHVIQYADYVIVIKEGRLVKAGEPAAIIDSSLLQVVYGVRADEFLCSNGKQALLPISLIKLEKK